MALATAALSGCAPAPPERIAAVMPMTEAVQRVNENNNRMGPRMMAKGGFSATWVMSDGVEAADGSFKLQTTPDGLLNLTGAIDFVGDAFDLGCNADVFWYWQKLPDGQDHMSIGHVQAGQVRVGEVPVDPRSILDAIGNQLISTMLNGPDAPRYRVTPAEHQLIYESRVDDRHYIEKELWLSRYPPFLIERVLMRDPGGHVTVDARLSNYRPVQTGGPLLAHHIAVEMPEVGHRFDLKIRDVTLRDSADTLWFAEPNERPNLNPRVRIRPRSTTWLTDEPRAIELN